jgi:hypothetical protein
MGRRVIQCSASKQCEGLKALAAEEVDDPEFALSLADAKEQYLCNIPPHRYKRFRISNHAVTFIRPLKFETVTLYYISTQLI